VLERRALETLTQGHLSNHVIFHVFHTPAIADHARTIFGLRPATFRQLRNSGLSPATIAQRGGRTRAGAQTRIAQLLKARGQRAVSLGAMSRAQARALYAEQMANLAAFMSHTYRTPSQQVSFLCRAH
jgi:signal transduction histidine kinase